MGPEKIHYYPIMNWTNTQVFHYLRLRHIPLPPEYRWLTSSWGDIRGEELYHVKTHFPNDYKKILEVFPYAEAIERRYEIYRLNASTGTATVPHEEDASVRIDSSTIQPPTD